MSPKVEAIVAERLKQWTTGSGIRHADAAVRLRSLLQDARGFAGERIQATFGDLLIADLGTPRAYAPCLQNRAASGSAIALRLSGGKGQQQSSDHGVGYTASVPLMHGRSDQGLPRFCLQQHCFKSPV